MFRFCYTGYEIYNIRSSTLTSVNAKNNWWGTDNEQEIQNKIYDVYDDISKGLVGYTPWLNKININAPISPPVIEVNTSVNNNIFLQWAANSESDTASYKLYWDNDGFPFDNMEDVGNNLNFTLTNLSPGTYHIGITAYDTNYLESNNDPDTIVNENQTSGHESWFSTMEVNIE